MSGGIAKDGTYLPAGVEAGPDAVGRLVMVMSADSRQVIFAPYAGGFAASLAPDVFAKEFREVTRDTVLEWTRVYRPMHATAEFFPDDAPPLPAFSNGFTWNGWEVPLMTGPVVRKAIEDGLMSNPEFGSMLYFDEGRDAVVSVSSLEGRAIPESLTPEAVGALLDAASDSVTVDDAEFGLEASRGFDIGTDDGPAHVYQIGFGWCWYRADEPSAAPAP